MSVPKCVRFIVFVKFDSTGKHTVDQDEITIALKSRPNGNKVNLELINKLAGYFGANKDEIRIIIGRTSSKKLVEVHNRVDP
jgi:uncharacterized protein YggU (UPF0235/DUF167 family)